MPSVEQELDALNSQIAAAQTAKARATVERENEEKRLAEALKSLEEEFNVKTVEDAEALAKKLEAGMTAAIEKAKAALEASKG
jgi:hypothetical protein